jgi:hypothetical protein
MLTIFAQHYLHRTRVYFRTETLTAGRTGSSSRRFSTACAGQSTEVRRNARGAAAPSLAVATPAWPNIEEACCGETWQGPLLCRSPLSYDASQTPPPPPHLSAFCYISGNNAASGPVRWFCALVGHTSSLRLLATGSPMHRLQMST